MARRVQPAGWQAARLIDMGGGLVTAVAPDLLNDNEAQVAEWVDFSQKGTIRPALGRRKRYASAFSSYPVRGIHGYYKKDGTSRLLLYAGGVVYYDLPHVVFNYDSQADWEQEGVYTTLDTKSSPGDLKLQNPSAPSLLAGIGYVVGRFGQAAYVGNPYLAVAHANSPYITIYKRSGDTFTKLGNPDTLPTGTGRGCAFDPDGVYLAVAHYTSPYITIYKRSGDSFTKLSNPDVLPTGNAYACAFDPSGTYLAVGHAASPYITIYKRSGDTFAKLSNPDVLPTGTCYDVAFDPTGTYLAVAHYDSPYITIYKRSGDTFTKLSDPDVLPTGVGYSCAFDPTGTYLAVGHRNSPFITIYKRSGDTFTKLGDPNVLPAGDGRGSAFDPGGAYLVVSHVPSPYITIYKRSGDTFTKLPDPDTLPGSTAYKPAFDPTGTYLAMGVYSSPYVAIYKRSGDTFTRLADPSTLPAGAGYGCTFGTGIGTGAGFVVPGTVVSSKDGTIECWIRLYSVGGTQYVFDGAGPANQSLTVYVNADGKLCLECGTGSSTVTLVGTTVLEAGTWYAVAWRWSPEGVALFLNGGVEASSAQTPSISFGTNVYFASKSDATSPLSGFIDDLRISFRARTDAEIAVAYQSGLPLEWDIDTTYLLHFDGNLDLPADRQGVWASTSMDVSTVQDKESGVVTWDVTLPPGASLQVETRTSADGSTWSDWEPVAANGAINSPGNNYIQVRAKLATDDIAAGNPSLGALHVIFDGEPSVTQLITGLAPAAEAFFETFRDLCIMVNGYDAPQKWDGVNAMTNLGGSPPSAQFCQVFQNRLWMASSASNPSRVWFSDLLDPETWPAFNYIDVAPEDGDRITGLYRYKDWLVVTKSRSTWVILGDSIENFALRCVFPTFGSVSMRGLAVLGGQLVVVSADGIRFTDLAAEALASERIRPTWEALNPRRLGQVAAFASDHLLYVCGPNGSSITNDTALVYDSIRQCWSTRPGLQVGCACHFVEGGHTKLLLGSSVEGQVYTLDAETDLGNVVPMKWESKAWNFGVPEAVKAIRRLFLNVKSPGSVGRVRVYLRPDLGGLFGPVELDYPGDGKVHTLMLLVSMAGLATAKHVSVRVEAVTPASRFELHSLAVEFLGVGVRL